MFKKNILCVMSIMTIILSISFVVLTFMYPVEYSETMKTVYTTIVAFYFSYQIYKKEGNNDGKQ